jgi:hypothetical protein
MKKIEHFTTETKTVLLGDKPITLISRTPILSPQQYERRRQEVEAKLYDACIRHQRTVEQAKAEKQTGKQNPS